MLTVRQLVRAIVRFGLEVERPRCPDAPPCYSPDGAQAGQGHRHEPEGRQPLRASYDRPAEKPTP